MYKLTDGKAIIRVLDGAYIPADENNSDYSDYLKWLKAGNMPEPNDDPQPYIPQSVTRFQARAALMLTPSAHAFDNMLAEVDAFMTHQDTDPMARLAWTEAQEFYRQSPTVLAMSAVLNLSDAQLDQLFTLAATLHA